MIATLHVCVVNQFTGTLEYGFGSLHAQIVFLAIAWEGYYFGASWWTVRYCWSWGRGTLLKYREHFLEN